MKIKFYQSSSGRSPVEKFVAKLSESLRSDFLDCVIRLSKGETLRMPTSRNLSSIERGLHELRLKDSSGIYRVFYCIKVGDAIYFLHAFQKKTQEIPKNELKIVLKRLREV